MTSRRTSILVVDDNDGVRAGIVTLLRRHPEVSAVHEADSGEAALSLATEVRPAVALIDLVLPGIDGFATATALKERCPECALVFLSSHAEPARVTQAIALGVAGYIVKSDAVPHLRDALSTILQGGTWFSRGLVVSEPLTAAARSDHVQEPRATAPLGAGLPWQFFDQLPEAIAVFRDERVAYVNAAWCQLYHRRREDVVGGSWRGSTSAPNQAWIEHEVLPAVAATGRYVGERTLVTVDGETLDVEVRFSQTMPNMVVAVSTDITHRARAERDTRAKNVDLAHINALLRTTHRHQETLLYTVAH